MKSPSALVVVVALFLCPFVSHAEDEVFSENIGDNTFYYTINSNLGATITESEINGENITIPSMLGGFPVMAIGEKAFFGKTGMKTVTMPVSITRIEDNAFSGCLFLESVEIPETVMYLGNGCFTSCMSLEKVTFNCSVSAIPENCFSACTSLTCIDIPDSVMIIGREAFFGCTAVPWVFVPPTVESIGENALGMRYNVRTNRVETINGFKIKGLPNTTAQAYAEENGIEFKYNKGDVNFDGFIDSVDASYVLLEYSFLSTGGVSTFSGFQNIPADYNLDGFIDSVDASLILAEYARLQTSLTN